MLKVEAKRDERVRSSIVDAAKKLFQQYGLAKTTMEDIARSIGRGKSSLYYYYPTKEDIFEAVLLNEKQSIINEISTAVAEVDSAEEKLRTYAQTISTALKKRIILFNIIRSEMNDEGCLMKVFKKKYDTIEIDLLRSIIDYGIQNGEFKQLDKDQLDDVSLICVSMLRGLRLNLIDEGNSGKDISELINFSIDLLIKALKK
jgi:AcrR family transcriptional regulator